MTVAHPLLRYGSRGEPVTLLQRALNIAGPALAPLTDDGIFGSKTLGRVVEFQRQKSLVADGIVGPNTHGALGQYYEQIAKLVDHFVRPEDQAQARERIVSAAQQFVNVWGWPPYGSPPPNPTSQRIAGQYCSNPVTRARQGGAAMALIFQTAGHPEAAKCLTISEAAEAMYLRAHTAKERNQIDIVSWCGIFALTIYKWAGLKMSSWPLRIEGLTNMPPELRVTGGELQKGDIGIIEPFGGRNHHFVITNIAGSQISSIDGNVGQLQTVLSRTYTLAGKIGAGTYKINSTHGAEKVVFVSPIWEKVLTL